jgi:gliding motility-associated-like protein
MANLGFWPEKRSIGSPLRLPLKKIRMMTIMKSIYALLFLTFLAPFSVLGQCNAGNNTTANLCSNGSPKALITLLGGAPVNSGSWIDNTGAAFPDTFDPSADAAGVYRYVVLVDPMGNPCALSDTAFLTITINTVPTATFTINDNEGCGSLSAQFTNTTVAPGYTTCIWSFGNGGASTACNPIHNYIQEGQFDVTLTISNGIGCQAVVSELSAITVLEAPDAGFSLEESPISSATGLGKFINESTGADYYEWVIPMVGNYGDMDPLVQFPPKEASYFVCLEATAMNGCADTYCATIYVRDEIIIYVPSAFTADKDGINDIFRPKLTFDPQIYEFKVFDRWGNIVFETNEPLQGWNGSSSTGQVYSPDSFYPWHIKAVKNGVTVERRGEVLMLR